MSWIIRLAWIIRPIHLIDVSHMVHYPYKPTSDAPGEADSTSEVLSDYPPNAYYTYKP